MRREQIQSYAKLAEEFIFNCVNFARKIGLENVDKIPWSLLWKEWASIRDGFKYRWASIKGFTVYLFVEMLNLYYNSTYLFEFFTLYP
jgi:hypothetical protein